MLAAVSRDTAKLTGGISGSGWTRPGTVQVEPIARLTQDGKWIALPCSSNNPKPCRQFERDYLSKPHIYTVISADGRGATVHATPTKLDECYGYTGTGTYSGPSIQKFAIAAGSTPFFAESSPPRLLTHAESAAIRKALTVLVPKKLDSTEQLRIFSLRLEGQNLFVVQRAFSDIADPINDNLKLIFTIGAMRQDRFHVLYWKQDIEDENERVLGAIRLKNGREFLITSITDPESQIFHVYGIRNGRLTLVFSGGGSSC